MTWCWISKRAVTAIHDEQIIAHGGLRGIRDSGLLESALDRPRNIALYTKTNVSALAAAYAFGLVKNHAFVDGNKRTAFVTAALFLLRNGREPTGSETDVVLLFNDVATGDVTQADLADWFKANSTRRH